MRAVDAGRVRAANETFRAAVVGAVRELVDDNDPWRGQDDVRHERVRTLRQADDGELRREIDPKRDRNARAAVARGQRGQSRRCRRNGGVGIRRTASRGRNEPPRVDAADRCQRDNAKHDDHCDFLHLDLLGASPQNVPPDIWRNLCSGAFRRTPRLH